MNNSVTKAKQKTTAQKVPDGKTFSDTLTALVLEFEPDTGMASYYGEQFHGKKTSSGEVYNMHANTCAHRWLPYGTLLRVTNISNGKSAVVRVTDRGPFKHGRMIDISKNAAKEIDLIRRGTGVVEIKVVAPE
ncbi:MAG: septal ring lytic transglycosylase RlpA family protein [Ignavibacteria bacterium]|nr:septal ring lytic transglycosylase RlpA family protein [Ignavibacteria bacterium]